ncbi:MAG: MerR family transcriptional regulator [Firmicutes bacterium]|nr:MerR family transcriptional regulator [Bacillota bacterium]
MNPNEVAALTGVSVRTLHHYDQIGLLRPARNPDNDYREYTHADLDLLQQILFFRECGFSLRRIRELLKNPGYDRDKAYALQLNYLRAQKRRIDAMLLTLERSIKASKGELTMTLQDKFSGFDFSKNPYEAEARKLWGDPAVDRSNEALARKTDGEKHRLAQDMNGMFAGLAAVRREAPDSAAAQEQIDRMYRFFNEHFGVHYTLEAFAGLGQMYIGDPRFTKNIDAFGDGLSAFLAEAMAIYAKNGQR